MAGKNRANAPSAHLKNNINIKDAKAEPKRIREILTEIEDKVFKGRFKLYSIFKRFDKDGDGFVSYDDFQNCLSSIKVSASDEEVAAVLKHVDLNNSGHLDFSEFSKVFSRAHSAPLRHMLRVENG